MTEQRPVLTVKLPNQAMHHQLKQVAVKNRQSVSAIVREAIGHWMECSELIGQNRADDN